MSDEDKTAVFRAGALPPPESGRPANAPRAKLVCVDDRQLGPAQKRLVIELDGAGERTLGRDRANPIFIESHQVSRTHAALYPVDGGWGVRDLKSTNGVWVNDKQVGDARLEPGDTVRFGTIAFRFELERARAPEPAGLARFKALGDGDTEKTMNFRDVRAASKLLAAQDTPEADAAPRAAAQPVTPPPKPLVKPAAQPPKPDFDPERTTALDMVAERKKLKRMVLMKRAYFGGVALLVVVAAYFGYLMLRASNIVESERDRVNAFVRDAAALEDAKRFPEDRKLLAGMKRELVKAIADAPDKPELPALLDRVIALEFERDFYDAMAAANFGEARAAIAAAQRKLGVVRAKAAAPGEGGAGETQNLLATMEPVVPLREFAKAYPDPAQKSAAPMQAQLDEMLKQKAELMRMQRLANMDLVRHPFLARLLDQASQDIRVVERWDTALRVAR